jgi:hypothetical protein
MGLFDALTGWLTELASDTERAGKVVAAQARAVSLRGDVRRTERELGAAALVLVARGETLHPDLAQEVEALRGAQAALEAKEREIGELRAASSAGAGGGGDRESGGAGDAGTTVSTGAATVTYRASAVPAASAAPVLAPAPMPEEAPSAEAQAEDAGAEPPGATATGA